MAWKPIAGQVVLARLDGKVRQVLVTAWDSYTGAVRVDWPPENPAVVSRYRSPARAEDADRQGSLRAARPCGLQSRHEGMRRNDLRPPSIGLRSASIRGT